MMSTLKKLTLIKSVQSMIFSRTIIAACEYQLFEKIELNKSITIDELSEDTGIKKEALRKILRILQNKKFISIDAYDCVKLTKQGYQIFIDPNTRIIDYIRLQKHTWKRFSNFDKTIMKSSPKIDYHQDNENKQAYVNGMYQISRIISGRYAKKVHLESTYTTLLDVGGAGSYYAQGVQKRYPQIKVYVLDLPNQIENIRSSSLCYNPAYTYIQGNIFDVQLDMQWDVILINNFVHLFTHQEVQKIIDKLYGNLKTNGKIIIFDQFFGINKIFDRFCSYMDLNYLTVGGACHDKSDIYELLAKYFPTKSIKFRPLYIFPGCGIFETSKQ